MIKYILWDIDDVLLIPPYYASEKAINEYNLNPELVSIFFKEYWPLCITHKLKLTNCIHFMLLGSDFEDKGMEYLNFWFRFESVINLQIMKMIQKLKNNGIKSYLASNQESCRADYIWYELEFKEIFTDIYISESIGVKKPDLLFYSKIFSNFKENDKEKFLFIDDNSKNINSASKFGFKTHLFKGNESLINCLQKYFPEGITSMPSKTRAAKQLKSSLRL